MKPRPRHISAEEFAIMQQRVGGRIPKGTGTAYSPQGTRRSDITDGAAPSPLLLALTGQLPSGKNQVQLLFRKGKVHKYPNKTFTNWRALAHTQILEQVELTLVRDPIYCTPVRLTVEYWPGDERTRDVSGQLDALFHLLVYAKVLKDDGLVHDVIWKRQGLNRKFPKTILTVEAV